MLQQVNHAHRIRGLPRILEGQLGRQAAKGRVEREPAFAGELQRREGDPHLGDRADAKEGIGGRVRAGPHAGLADPGGPAHPLAIGDDDAHAGDVVLVKDGFEASPQLGVVARHDERGLVGEDRSAGEQGNQREAEDESETNGREQGVARRRHRWILSSTGGSTTQ